MTRQETLWWTTLSSQLHAIVRCRADNSQAPSDSGDEPPTVYQSDTFV